MLSDDVFRTDGEMKNDLGQPLTAAQREICLGGPEYSSGDCDAKQRGLEAILRTFLC